MPRTKIVVTIGPASASRDRIRDLIEAGMSVARINFSHGDHATHTQTIATLREVGREMDGELAILGDLQGPKLRVGKLPKGGIELTDGSSVVLADAPFSGQTIPVPHPKELAGLEVGQRVLLDDGRLELHVEQVTDEGVVCRIVVGGKLTSSKGLSLPDTRLSGSAITPKDRQDLGFAVEHGVDLIALSFVRAPEDVAELRELLGGLGASIPIVAKIEKPQALACFDAVLEKADGIMVARGDLGVETPAEEVPFHQKRIILACNRAGKPVITATQMLQSMIEWPTPTRAEASDVANAILDGTDAVMLSGETAIGKYPVETVRTMARICSKAEEHLEPGRSLHLASDPTPTVTEAISRATVDIADEVGAKAILVATMSGTTARMVARYRPRVPIVAVTPSEQTLKRLSLTWGVAPVLVSEFPTTDETISLMEHIAYKNGVVKGGDTVVLTAGIPFGGEGRTNMLKVHVVGEGEA